MERSAQLCVNMMRCECSMYIYIYVACICILFYKCAYMYNGSSIMGWSTNSSKYPWRGWNPHVCWDTYPRTVHWNCTSSETDQPPHHRSPGGHRTHWHRRHGHWHWHGWHAIAGGLSSSRMGSRWCAIMPWKLGGFIGPKCVKHHCFTQGMGTSTGNRCDYIALRWEHQGAKVGTPVLIECNFHSDKHAIWCYGLWYGR